VSDENVLNLAIFSPTNEGFLFTVVEGRIDLGEFPAFQSNSLVIAALTEAYNQSKIAKGEVPRHSAAHQYAVSNCKKVYELISGVDAGHRYTLLLIAQKRGLKPPAPRRKSLGLDGASAEKSLLDVGELSDD
jgi:hypothetical protein